MFAYNRTHWDKSFWKLQDKIDNLRSVWACSILLSNSYLTTGTLCIVQEMPKCTLHFKVCTLCNSLGGAGWRFPTRSWSHHFVKHDHHRKISIYHLVKHNHYHHFQHFVLPESHQRVLHHFVKHNRHHIFSIFCWNWSPIKTFKKNQIQSPQFHFQIKCHTPTLLLPRWCLIIHNG